MSDQREVFLVWDNTRLEKGEGPALEKICATMQDAVDHARATFDEDDDVTIDTWQVGKDYPTTTTEVREP